MTKSEALAEVRQAVLELVDAQGGSIDRFRTANAHLAIAQLRAAEAGATSFEINAASEWGGLPV
jgi:hypothetical protein